MTTIRTVDPYAPKEKITGSEVSIVDQTRSAIFKFVKHAGDDVDPQEAQDLAEKLADELRAARDQLRASHDQINALEKWLHQISCEIEQRSSLRPDDGRSAGRLGF